MPSFPSQIDSAGAGQYHCNTGEASINGSYPGVFSSGTDLYQVLGDIINFKLRCYKSTDGGLTWIEQDAANAPSFARGAFAGVPNGQGYSVFQSCFDSANGVIYTAFRIPTTFLISMIPFTIGVGWGAVDSSIIGVPVAPESAYPGSSLACEFRPADGSVYVVFAVLTGIGDEGKLYGKVYNGGFTVLAPTLLAGTPGDKRVWNTSGLRRDSSGVLHLVISCSDFTLSPNAEASLWHLSIPSNNIPSLLTGIVAPTLNAAFHFVSVPFISAGDKLSFTYVMTSALGVVTAHVARAQAVAIPIWTDETPAPMQVGTIRLQGTITLAGIDYVFYGFSAAPNKTYAYISDSGSGWSAQNVIGSIDQTGPITSATDVIPSVANTTTGAWGLTLVYYGPSGLATNGVGFWSAAAAPAPVAPVATGIQFQIIPFPVMVDCCYPMVSCIRCSKDGRLYVAAKGPLKIGL